jgi:low temperature requirement protein LtrA
LEHRQVSFVELFYDLVYVAIIAELSHALVTHIGWVELGRFAFLFTLVWWAWLNGAAYHDIHGNNDIRTRVFTFLQMLTVVSMAIFAHDAMGASAVGFALSYAAFQLILTYMWWRTGVYDPEHAVLSNPYSAAFLSTTLLFAGSVFVPPPIRFYLWVAAFVISLLMPIIYMNLGRFSEKAQEQLDISTPVSPSFVERFGLFSIIVLGEVIVAVVAGLTSHHKFTLEIALLALLGVLTAMALWWLYFDFVSHRMPIEKNVFAGTTWIYLHLPTTLGITLVGASVLAILENNAELLSSTLRSFYTGGAAITLGGIALMTFTIQLPSGDQQANRKGRISMFASATLIALLGFSSFEALPLFLAVVILMITPVFFALLVWVAGQVTD